MSVLTAPRTHVPEKEAVAQAVPQPIDSVVRVAPQIITEQQVVFGTAAAVPLQPTRWWTAATRVVAMAGRRRFLASPPYYYPPRLDFLDDSRMEREMHRL